MVRVVTTVILAVAVLLGIWYLPLFPIQWILIGIIGVGLWEYSHLVFERIRTRLFTTALGLAFAAMMTWCYPNSPTDHRLLISLMGILFLSFLWVMRFQEPLEESIHRSALILLGVTYLGGTLPIWGWIQGVGREWVMLALFPTCLTDTFGFLVGRAIGKHKLAPRISPNKTWEGVAGSLLGAILGLWLANTLFLDPPIALSWLKLITLGLAMSVIAIFGDLIESLIKRSVRVKDSSHWIPGHGGFLDRLDALTFTAPFFYFAVLPCLR